MSRTSFFVDIKRSLFRGKFSQSQVDGINRLLDAMGDMEDKYKAYLLATAYHETARTMQPITEYGGRAYFDKYEGRSSLGNTEQGDGYKFRGRGDVMITGRRNYTLFSKLLGLPLTENPELVKDPDISARILIKGCTEGLFTGKKLSDYGTFKGMRRVVNGTDKASLIAGYAESFLEALGSIEIAEEPITTAKPIYKSTTNMAAGVAGLSMVAGASDDAREIISNLGIDPKWILLAVGLVAVGWVVKERILKKTKHGI